MGRRAGGWARGQAVRSRRALPPPFDLALGARARGGEASRPSGVSASETRRCAATGPCHLAAHVDATSVIFHPQAVSLLVARGAAPYPDPCDSTLARPSPRRPQAPKKKPTLVSFIDRRDYVGALTLLDFEMTGGGPVDDAALGGLGGGSALEWLAFCAFHAGDFQRACDAYDQLAKDARAERKAGAKRGGGWGEGWVGGVSRPGEGGREHAGTDLTETMRACRRGCVDRPTPFPHTASAARPHDPHSPCRAIRSVHAVQGHEPVLPAAVGAGGEGRYGRACRHPGAGARHRRHR